MTYLKLSIITIILASLVSCQKEEDFISPPTGIPTEVEFRSSTISTGSSPPSQPTIFYSATELIVQYDPSLTDSDRDDIRTDFQVPVYEACAHCDGTIEKWDFGPDADIEHKYATAKEKEADAEGIFMVDREFDFFAETVPAVLSGGTGLIDYSAQIVSSNSGITIAVLDSGIDANYPTFSGPFLYNNETEVPEIQSGWDYVEEDNNCYDDNEQVHGTAVASIINHYLTGNGISHQILPIKVANAAGSVSLFDAYCGISYAASVSNIIQMSFGWYDDGEEEDAFTNDIFGSMMERYSDVLFVSSAGNNESDNDALAHYPSNYNQPNKIAVAAANELLNDIADFSNFGASTVDFFSLGTNISFMNADEETVFISGTSFSAPEVAAIAARELYLSGMTLTPSELIATLDELGTPVTFSQPTFYNKILLPY